MHALRENANGVYPQGPAYLFPPRLTRARITHTFPHKCRVMNIHYFSVTFSRIADGPGLLLEGESRAVTGGAVILSHPVIRKRTLFHGGYKSREGRETTKNTSVGRKRGRGGREGTRCRVEMEKPGLRCELTIQRANNGHDFAGNACKNIPR